MTKDLVNIPGKEVTMITVEYPPGGADPVHRHNASAFVYVLEGSIVMQMKGGKKVTLHPGEHVLRRPSRYSPRREKCQRHQTREIPRLSGQGQRRTNSRSCKRVTPSLGLGVATSCRAFGGAAALGVPLKVEGAVCERRTISAPACFAALLDKLW